MSKAKGSQGAAEDLEAGNNGRSERELSDKYGNTAPTPGRSSTGDPDNLDSKKDATGEVREDKIEQPDEEDELDEDGDDDDEEDDDDE
jgi:hypothetical protein